MSRITGSRPQNVGSTPETPADAGASHPQSIGRSGKTPAGVGDVPDSMEDMKLKASAEKYGKPEKGTKSPELKAGGTGTGRDIQTQMTTGQAYSMTGSVTVIHDSTQQASAPHAQETASPRDISTQMTTGHANSVPSPVTVIQNSAQQASAPRAQETASPRDISTQSTTGQAHVVPTES